MIYIETKNKIITYTHYMPFDPEFGLGKSEEELKKTGYLVESIPEEYSGEIPEGKMPELHYNGSEFSWVMVDKPEDEKTVLEKEIESLKQQQAATNDAVLGLMSMITMQ